MMPHFASSEDGLSSTTLLEAFAVRQGLSHTWRMAKTPRLGRTLISGRLPPLYIGAWIRALGATPAAIARETGLNEGYLSTLVNSPTSNPSFIVVILIADYLHIPTDYFRRPPPGPAVLAQTTGIDPDTLSRLRPQP